MVVGQTLGHYRILDKLGAGGMGEVYLAEDTTLKRRVALKVLPPDLAANQERLDRFQQEAETLAALDHPNIVHIYSVEEVDGVRFLTMQLVEGKRLSDLIPKSGMPLERIFDIAIPLADALAAAHEKGVIHRDLKPGNIMVTDNGRVKVLDFGLAKLRPELGAGEATELPTEPMTDEGRILGTVPYMSPEQLEGRDVDARTDIFSLGIVLYEMATGQPPFRGQTTPSVLSAILKDTPTSVTELNPLLPRDMARIIRRCLVKDPGHRYQTVVDVRNELEELKHEVDSGDLEERAAPVVPAKGRKWILATVLMLAVIGSAIGTYLLVRPDRQAEEAPIEGTIAQLTSQGGLEYFPSLSPDSEFFVYDSPVSGNWDVYLKRVGGERVINLTEGSPAHDGMPAYSPDGKRIAFRSGRDGGGIFVMGATGESVRRLTDFGANPAWAPDGTRVVFSTVPVASQYRVTTKGGELWTVNIETEEVRQITEVDTVPDAVQPVWSPHGDRIAYWSVIGGQRDIWSIPSEGGEPVPVTSDEPMDWTPSWSPDGGYLYFSSDRGGTMSVWRAPIEEASGKVLGEPQLVTTAIASDLMHLSISQDGRRMAYVSQLTTENLQKVSFDPSTETIVGQPEWITRGLEPQIISPNLSPDGEWLAFTVGANKASPDVSVMRTDGTGRRNLTNDPYRNFGPAWSPDGQRLAFYGNRSGKIQLWLIEPDGSGLQQLTDMPSTVNGPVWSPDGSLIAGSLKDGQGLLHPHIFSSKGMDDRPPEALPQFGVEGTSFDLSSWSSDGRKLAGELYGSAEGIASFSFATREWKKLVDFGRSPKWLSDNRRLLLVSQGRLLLLDSVSGSYQEVLSVAPDRIDGNGFALSKDDRVIYFARRSVESDIWLLTFEEKR